MADEYTEIKIEYDDEDKRTFLVNGKSVGDYNFLIGHILDEYTDSRGVRGLTQKLVLTIDYDKVHFNARELINLNTIIELDNSVKSLRRKWYGAKVDITRHFGEHS